MFQKGFVVADTVIALALVLYLAAWGKVMSSTSPLEHELPYGISRQAGISEAERPAKSQVDSNNEHSKSNQPSSFESKDGPPKAEGSPEKPKEPDAITVYTWWLTAFTFVLAVATVLLAWWTRGLWRFAGRQAEDMKASIAVAQKTAKATMLQAEAAKEQAEISRSAMVASQRPWIKVEISAQGVYNREGRTTICLSVAVRNVGNYPATNVFPCIRIYFSKPPLVYNKYECIVDLRGSDCYSSGFPEPSETLFPGEGFVFESRRYISTRDYGVTNDNIKSFSIFVLGSAVYQFGTSSAMHHTAHLRELVWTKAGSRPEMITLLEESEIPANELELRHSPCGGDFAD
jgi:hypothetical protein